MDKVQLERFAHAIYIKVTEELIGEYFNQIDVEVEEDCFQSDVFVVRMIGRAMGRMLDSKTVKYPATWWDAFKLEVLPYWLRKRLVINYTTRTLVSRAVYPELDIKEVIYYDVE